MRNLTYVILPMICLSSSCQESHVQVHTKATWAILPGQHRLSFPIRSIAFAPSGDELLSAGDDGWISIWDIRKHTIERTLGGRSGKVKSLCFSVQGDLIASSSASSTDLWNFRSGKLIKRFRIFQDKWPDDFYSASFSPDGTLLATGSGRNGGSFRVALWNIKSGKLLKVLGYHGSKISSVSFSPAGNLLLSASYDNKLRVYDVLAGSVVGEIRGKSPFLSAVFAPDGASVAASSKDGILKVFEARALNSGRLLAGYTGSIKCLTFSRSGKVLVGGSSNGTVVLWDIPSGKVLETLIPRAQKQAPSNSIFGSNDVVSVSVSHDDQLLAAASYDKNITLWPMSQTGDVK